MKTQMTKKILMSALLLAGMIGANAAFAEDTLQSAITTQAAAKNLQQNMKEIGSIFKALSAAMNNASLNVESAKQASQLVELFKLTINQVPDSIDLFPPNEQAQALEDYKRLNQIHIDQAEKLAAAFAANDNSTAVAIIAQMNDTKKEGHTKYK